MINLYSPSVQDVLLSKNLDLLGRIVLFGDEIALRMGSNCSLEAPCVDERENFDWGCTQHLLTHERAGFKESPLGKVWVQ